MDVCAKDYCRHTARYHYTNAAHESICLICFMIKREYEHKFVPQAQGTLAI